MVSWPSVRSHLTTSLNLRYRPLRCFCSREEQKDSTMMSCSQLHPCVLLLLPVVYSEAAQPAIGRLWSRPHGAPSVSEAWHYTPPSDVKLRPAGPLWLYRRRTVDKTQGWGVPLLQICHCLGLPPLSPLDMDPEPPEDHNRWCNERKAGLAAILFSQLLHLRLV